MRHTQNHKRICALFFVCIVRAGRFSRGFLRFGCLAQHVINAARIVWSIDIIRAKLNARALVRSAYFERLNLICIKCIVFAFGGHMTAQEFRFSGAVRFCVGELYGNISTQDACWVLRATLVYSMAQGTREINISVMCATIVRVLQYMTSSNFFSLHIGHIA